MAKSDWKFRILGFDISAFQHGPYLRYSICWVYQSALPWKRNPGAHFVAAVAAVVAAAAAAVVVVVVVDTHVEDHRT